VAEEAAAPEASAAGEKSAVPIARMTHKPPSAATPAAPPHGRYNLVVFVDLARRFIFLAIARDPLLVLALEFAYGDSCGSCDL
jgi:hypothetical protein